MQAYLINQMFHKPYEQQVLELLKKGDATMRGLIENINLYGVQHQALLAQLQQDGWVGMTKSTYSLTDAGRVALANMQRKAA